jgi:hypothetical protein
MPGDASSGYGPFRHHATTAYPTAGSGARDVDPSGAQVPPGATAQAGATPFPSPPPAFDTGGHAPTTSGSDPIYGAAPTSGPATGGSPSRSQGPAYAAGDETPVPGPIYYPPSAGTPQFGAYGPHPSGSAYDQAPGTTAPQDPGYTTTPTSGAGPTPIWSPADPISGASPTPDPYGLSVTPSYSAGPRIEPTPKQPRSRLLLPALAGLLAGLVIFGTGGWFLGRSTGSDPAPAPPTPAPTTAAALPPYEQNQIAINQPKFTGPLAPVAQGWLPHLSGCSRSGEKDGPVLNKGEKARVRCEMDAMSVIFVEHTTAADRDKATVKTLGQNVDARTLTPGAGAPTRKATPSGRTNGNYVEYAYQASGRTVSGIWWDDSTAPVTAYLLAYWKEGTGQKWEPMRDVWARYA